VIVIGAGIAGLVAGHELKRQGHDVVVLEAQNRVGGRVHTLRTFGPGLYAEAGAMRLPRAHDLTIRYCEEFNLPMRPFVMGNPKGLVHVGGVRMTAQEANEHPSCSPSISPMTSAAGRPTSCGRRRSASCAFWSSGTAMPHGRRSCATTTSIRSTSTSASAAGPPVPSSTSA
jgi:hypothetical protein